MDLLEGSRYKDMEERYEDELKWPRDAASAALGAQRLADLSGDYWGNSDESDEGDQAIRVKLRFERDGRITGRGTDGVDGAYKITSGRWEALPNGGLRLAWKERYDEGFTAICMGECDAASGKIEARFTSSRNVS